MKKIILLLSFLSAANFLAQNVFLVEFATGISNPVEIVNAKDSRLFVVQQNGLIKILQPDGSVNPTNFLNISSKITFGGERGLLGLAFHPQYSNNGYFFVYYNNTAGNITVARYSVSSANPDVADANSEKILLNIPKPFTNHNGGSMHFAPDGNLWISTGDGGSGGDPQNHSQNKNSLLGKMLRIDVNAAGPYNIPADNPFVGVDGADEVWSFGLRNAWKFSFDLPTGNVMIADVGQGQFEEINKMPITTGGINYGWRCYEGNNVYNNNGCAAASTMTFPVAVYNHSGGKCSITGGYVYHGTNFPVFHNKYFFADYCSEQIGILNPDNSISWTPAFSGKSFTTFGVDINNELYVSDASSGKILKITTPDLAADESIRNRIKIYPNPASTLISISGLKTKNNSIEIFSSDGRKVLESKIDEDGTVNVSALKTGIYFANVKSENQKVYSQKLMIK